MKKRMVAVLIVTVLLVSMLVGCSSGNGENSTSTNSTNGNNEKIIFKLAHVQSGGHPIDEAANRLAELMAERTDGRVEIQVFPSNMMGGEAVTRDMVKEGSIDMVLLGSAANNYNNAMELPSTFYLLDSYEEADYMLFESDFAKKYMYDDWRDNHNVLLLDSWTMAPRQTMSIKPFTNSEELSRIKLRVPAGIPVWESAWNAMGAMTVSLGLDDAFSGLQQGVCDAVEGPIDQLSFYSFQEVAKNLILTEHSYYSYQPLINIDSFNKLSESDQEILRETVLECGDLSDKLRDEFVDELTEEMRAEGVNIIELTEDEKAAFADKANQAMLDSMDVWGQDVYDEFMAELEEFRSN